MTNQTKINRSELAITRVLKGERVPVIAKDLGITPQSIYDAMKSREIKIKTLRDDIEKTTHRATVHLTPPNIDILNAGIDPVSLGRSGRVNGIIERYEVIYNSGVSAIVERFAKEDIMPLVRAMNSSNKSGSWILAWASLENDSNILKSKVLTLTETEAAIFEEYLSRTPHARVAY